LQVGDGAALPLRHWLSERGEEPKAIILALHGFNDYSFAFNYLGEYFAPRGVAVYAYDQRGFGANEPAGIWPGTANLARDMQRAMEAIKATHPNVPLFVLGESMGGAVVIASCAQYGCYEADGLILAAPALWGEDFISSLTKSGLWILAHTIPSSEWTGEDLDILASDNLRVLYEMGTDPLVIKETRVDAVYGLVDLMDEANARIGELARPVLMLYGAKDEIIPAFPVAKAIRRLTASHNVGYYPLGYHMLLRDFQREVVMYDILYWIENRYHPLPSASDMGWKEELLGIEE